MSHYIYFRRTVHSLAKLLCYFPGVKLQYVSPDVLAMPDEIKQIVAEKGVREHPDMHTYT